MCWTEINSDNRTCAYVGANPEMCQGLEFGAEKWAGRYSRCLSMMHGSCAVVGSSEHLLSESFGNEIDKHEVVIRINSAMAGTPENGLAASVGTRTDVRFVNGFGLDPEEEKNNRNLCLFLHEVPVHEKCGRQCWRDPMYCKGCSFADAQIECLYMNNISRPPSDKNTIIMDHLHGGVAEALLMFSESKSNHFITAGFKALTHALHICERVTVYGFGPSCNLTSGLKYFHEDRVPQGNHAYNQELATLISISGTSPKTALVPYKRHGAPISGIPEGHDREIFVQNWVRAQHIKLKMPGCLRNPNFTRAWPAARTKNLWG